MLLILLILNVTNNYVFFGDCVRDIKIASYSKAFYIKCDRTRTEVEQIKGPIKSTLH